MERKEEESLSLRLQAKFLAWENVRVEGSSSPIWTDGQELNYIRDSIISIKREMEFLNFYPEVYYRETPDKMPECFIIHAEEIRRRAKEVLRICKEDKNYRFLLKNAGKIEGEENARISLDGVLNSVFQMERVVYRDNLVKMKQYDNPSKYLKNFQICRKELEEVLEELELLKPEEKEAEPEMKYEQMKIALR